MVKFEKAVGEFLETLTSLELKRVVAKGHMMQADYRRLVAELEVDIAEAERLLSQRDEEEATLEKGA